MKNIRIEEVKLKTAIIYDAESYQTIVLQRWNGSVTILKDGKELVIDDSSVLLLAKALKEMVALDYDEE